MTREEFVEKCRYRMAGLIVYGTDLLDHQREERMRKLLLLPSTVDAFLGQMYDTAVGKVPPKPAAKPGPNGPIQAPVRPPP